jgi:hypothetical protein
LYIEEVSDEEVNKYFQYFEAKERKLDFSRAEKLTKSRNDKNVVSHEAPETTKMSFAYMKEDEKKENEINVNGNFQSDSFKKRHGLQGINDILKHFDIKKVYPQLIVQKTKPTVQTKPKLVKKQKPDEILKRDYLAEEIATALGDRNSLGAFRKIAERIPEWIIREYLAKIKEAWQDGKIRKSRGALFISMIQQYSDNHNIDLGFRAGIASVSLRNGS